MFFIFNKICNPFNGNVILRTQKQVDEFGSQEYETITGYLIIGGYDCKPLDLCPKFSTIENMNSLKNIKQITGGLTIRYNKGIMDFSGLHNFEKLQSLSIDVSLDNFRMEELDSLRDGLYFNGYGTNSLNGLENVKYIGGEIDLSNCLAPKLNLLRNITSIKSLSIRHFPNLLNLDDLRDLNSVSGKLEINGNGIIDFCGIKPLLSNNGVQGELRISYNEYNPSKADIVSCKCAIVNAGNNQWIKIGTTTKLEAVHTSLAGVWSIVSGEGGDFESENDPNSIFYGLEGHRYVLRWVVSGFWDEVSINFSTGIADFD